MKVKLKGNITSVERAGGSAKINLDLAGNVDIASLEAKKAEMIGTLLLKTLVADQLKLGTVLYVTVSDSEE